MSCPTDNWHCDGPKRGERKARSRVDTGWYRPDFATPRSPRFGPPEGFDQMAPSRDRPQGQIRPVSAPVAGRAIITIWSNRNATYLWDRTLIWSLPVKIEFAFPAFGGGK